MKIESLLNSVYGPIEQRPSQPPPNTAEEAASMDLAWARQAIAAAGVSLLCDRLQAVKALRDADRDGQVPRRSLRAYITIVDKLRKQELQEVDDV